MSRCFSPRHERGHNAQICGGFPFEILHQGSGAAVSIWQRLVCGHGFMANIETALKRLAFLVYKSHESKLYNVIQADR